jgi:hypothetical protein
VAKALKVHSETADAIHIDLEGNIDMQKTRATRAVRFSAFALVVVLAAGCSSSEQPETALFDQAGQLATALIEAVSATRQTATGFAEPGTSARAITAASSASGRVANAASRTDSVTERNLGLELAIVADQVVALLAAGEIDQAERMRTRDFVPAATELWAMQRGTTPDQASSGLATGPNLAIALAVVLVLAVGAAASIRRGSSRKRPAAARSGESIDARPPNENPRHTERTWDTPHPLYPGDQADDPATQDEGETHRTARLRTIEVELGQLLDSTLEQVKDRGWDVSLVCPTVTVLGDPIRIQRAVLSVLGNAYLAGAQRVGIVVDDRPTGVLLSIGHDAPFDEADTEDVTSRLVGQLGQATGSEDLDWSSIRDDDVSLITVSLGQALAVREPAESST